MRLEREIREDFKQLQRATVNFNTLPVLAKRQLNAAELPPLYVAAKKHLAKLMKVDELKDIADKHSAIAHYAKQIQDKSLLYYAERVYMRALERIGELLHELSTTKERAALAKRHGIGSAVAQSAYAMSFLPRRARNVLIERTPPANRHELEHAGRRLMPKGTRYQRQLANGEGFHRFASYQEPLGRSHFVIDCILDAIHDGDHNVKPPIDPAPLSAGLTPAERAELHKKLTPVIEWLDRFDQILSRR